MQADSVQNITVQNQMLAADSIKKEPPKQLQSFLSEKPFSTFESKAITKHTGDGISILFLVGLILIAISNVVFRKRFSDLFKAFWARNYSNQLMREGSISREQLGFMLFIVYLISIPLFFSFTIIQYLPNQTFELKLSMILVLITSFLGVWIYRIAFIRFTAILFKTYKASNEVLTQIFIFNLISGIVVLPFSILYYYSGSKDFIILGLIIWSLVQFYRFIRLFVVGLSYAIFSGLHLFLYLCTLEIIPIVIMLKILSIFYL